MFNYYGRKGRIIKFYPAPKYDFIVEPFAGSASYATAYSNRNIILNDLDESVYRAWRCIIGSTRDQIRLLPEPVKGESLSDYDLTEDERSLIAFTLSAGAFRSTSCSQWAAEHQLTRLMKDKVLKHHLHFKRWKIFNKDYRELDDYEATWFIDPPYMSGGEYYIKNKINYRELAAWCKSRRGQVIVCENGKADWLPFVPLVYTRGVKTIGNTKKKTIELIWTNYERKEWK